MLGISLLQYVHRQSQTAWPDVLVLFRDNGGPVNPTVAQIQAFDAGLFADNNSDLTNIMAEFPAIGNSQATRSRVLLYSRSGDGDLRDRIRGACQYFANTQSL